MNEPRPLARGDVVLVRFPFTDLSGLKVRPALVVGQVTGDDLILAFVSSRTARPPSPAEHHVDPSDPEFGRTGLRVASLVRLDRLVTLQRALALRRLGAIGPRTQTAIAGALRYVFDL